ncbi:competence protein CoiA family protein [Arthrobacter sp. 2MCAF14]|uniref:competence protein CoiA family protein n=1 Tax=Arthrobacter sp. 2MCAF14 TaxID=3232982 RepID=UPI003F928813
MSTMRRHDTIYAVVGSPEARDVVTAPAEKYAARRMRSEAQESRTSFFCSIAVGGCGSKLKLAAGDMRIPYFSHAPQAVCDLSDATARDGYTHLAIQEELKRWIEGTTSLRCDLEVATSDRKGRSDLVVRDAEDTHRLGLEIQLSPLTHAEMQRRSNIYLKCMNHVQWLYGHEEIQACRSQVERGGYAFRVRIDMETKECDLGYFGFHGGGSLQTAWRPLRDWIVRRNGLYSPSIKSVLEEAKAKAEIEHASKPKPPPETYQSIYTGLSEEYGSVLTAEYAAVRERVIAAIYRSARKGQLDESTAVELLVWLRDLTKHSAWWRRQLLGPGRKGPEIVIRVLEVYRSQKQ